MLYPHPGIFTRRDVFSKFGVFDLQYRICADYDWLLRVYYNGVRIAFIDILISYFSLGGVSSGPASLVERKAVSLKNLPPAWYDKYYHKIEEEYDKGVLWYKYHYILAHIHDNHCLAKMIKETLPIGDRCSLFGSGMIAAECYELTVALDIKIEHIYDNNQNKQGKDFRGILVETPDRIRPDEAVIIGSTLYADEMKKQLVDRQVMKNIGFSDIMKIVVSCAEKIKGKPIDLEGIENV